MSGKEGWSGLLTQGRGQGYLRCRGGPRSNVAVVRRSRATVVTRVPRNQTGRFRISGIEVELCPTAPAGERAGLERCQAVFQDYCTVTESVREGIPVTVSFTQLASELP